MAYRCSRWGFSLKPRVSIGLRATIAAVTVLLLCSCASYPGSRGDNGNCVPLYGGTLVTLPKAGYRLSDGSFIPMDQIIVMKDGGLWKCGD
jgi:hypothetical protein